MPPSHPTMKDVARTAGVHHSTVSLALRNHASIPPATRERIRRLADKLGYTPNPLVSALMAQRCANRTTDKFTTIAYIATHAAQLSWREIPYFAHLFEGAQKRVRELGYRLEEFTFGPENLSTSQLQRIFRARNIRGVLIGPLPQGLKTISLDWNSIVAVSLSLSFLEPAIECVSVDQYLAARLAHQHCRAQGYSRVGFFMSVETSARLQDRWLAGFQLEQSHLPPAQRIEPLLYSGSDTDAPPPRILREWLGATNPDAVLCRTVDAPALDSARPASSPRPAVAVLDLPEGEQRFAGIQQSATRIGALGAELLIGKLHRNESGTLRAHQYHLLAGEWVDGPTLPRRRRRASGRT